MKNLVVLFMLTVSALTFAESPSSVCDSDYKGKLNKLGCEKILASKGPEALNVWNAIEALDKVCITTYDKEFDKGYKSADAREKQTYDVSYFNGYYGTDFDCSL